MALEISVRGKEKRLALGAYRDVGLAHARTKHLEARKVLSAGMDPGEQRKVEKLSRVDRPENSFGAIALLVDF